MFKILVKNEQIQIQSHQRSVKIVIKNLNAFWLNIANLRLLKMNQRRWDKLYFDELMKRLG